jgi:hypothetical protein
MITLGSGASCGNCGYKKVRKFYDAMFFIWACDAECAKEAKEHVTKWWGN